MDATHWDWPHLERLARQYAPGGPAQPEPIPAADWSKVWFTLWALELPRDRYIDYLVTQVAGPALIRVYTEAVVGLSKEDMLRLLQQGHLPSIGRNGCLPILIVRLSMNSSSEVLRQCLHKYMQLQGDIDWSQFRSLKKMSWPLVRVFFHYTRDQTGALARLQTERPPADQERLAWLSIRYRDTGMLLRRGLGRLISTDLVGYLWAAL